MLSSINLKNNKTSKSVRNKNLTKLNNNKEIHLAIEDAIKYYQIYYSNPNSIFLSQLKGNILNIYLSHYNLNDISVIVKILKKYKYFESIILAPSDPKKKSQKTTYTKYKREPITEGEKNKKEKEEKTKEVEYINIINKIISGIGKHLSFSDKIKSLTINNFTFNQNLASYLSNGIIKNNSIQKLNINNCKITVEEYEIILKGLLNHEKIEYLNLSNNNFVDKYGNIIGRIISRQTYRRDQAIWLLGLRDERPSSNNYTLGLISINLNGNKLSSLSAEYITTSLSLDQYIRSITLANNCFDTKSCKKFIYMLRRNLTLVNIDLRGNPGYDENINYRLVLKMSKNIKYLYNQFNKNAYTFEEYEKYKSFIDISFYNSNIPEDILKKFIENNKIININDINLMHNLNNKTDKNNKLKKEENSKSEKSKSREINSNSKTNNVSHYSINDNSKNKKINNYVNLLENKYNRKTCLNYNIKEKKSQNNNFIRNNSSSLNKNINKNLLQENLLLKRKLLEFKAKEIQNKLGKNAISIPDKYDNNNLQNNFNIAEDLLDKLNNVMNSMKLNKKSNIISQKNKILDNKEELTKNNYIEENGVNEKKENKNEDEIKENENKFNNIDYLDII